jgi:hypothetical protein
MGPSLLKATVLRGRAVYQKKWFSQCSTHMSKWTEDPTYRRIEPPTQGDRQWCPPEVSPNIIRPGYALNGGVSPWDDIIPLAYPIGPPEWYDEHLAEGMRNAGRRAAECLEYAMSLVKPGITTRAIDLKVFEWAMHRSFYPSSLNYGRFPGSLCTSVNNVVSHGVPNQSFIFVTWLTAVNHCWTEV